jgi:hypothetical protein
VLAQAALGVRIFSTADVGAENNAADLAVAGQDALAQIDTVAETLAEQKKWDEQGQVNKAIKKATRQPKKPKVDIDLEEMGGGLEDRFRETYRQREQVTRDLDGNILQRSGSGSASGSWSASGSGSYENSRGSGSWALSASMSYSVDWEHNWSAHSDDSPDSPDGPVPIEVNPCDCCDCGPGASKVPLLFESKSKAQAIYA